MNEGTRQLLHALSSDIRLVDTEAPDRSRHVLTIISEAARSTTAQDVVLDLYEHAAEWASSTHDLAMLCAGLRRIAAHLRPRCEAGLLRALSPYPAGKSLVTTIR